MHEENKSRARARWLTAIQFFVDVVVEKEVNVNFDKCVSACVYGTGPNMNALTHPQASH